MDFRCVLRFFLISLFLTGCATRISQLGTTQALQRPGYGYVAATLVFKIDSWDQEAKLVTFPIISANFYSSDTPKDIVFSLNTSTDLNNIGLWSDPSSKLDEPRGRRVMTLVPVRPGKYRLGRVYAEFSAYHNNVTLDANNPPVVEVKEGQITYVGSVQLVTSVGKNIFGQTRPAGATLVLRDEFTADVGAMKNVDSRLANMAFLNGIAKQR